MDGTNGELSLDDRERQALILELRDAGTSWKDIERQFGLTRQQARYAYQLGKRARRRRDRRAND